MKIFYCELVKNFEAILLAALNTLSKIIMPFKNIDAV